MRGLHVYDEGEELAIVIYRSCGDVGSTAYDMVAVGDSAHGGVECRTAVARGDDDGCAVMATYGVEQLLYEDGEHLTCCTGWGVVDGQALGGGAGGEFWEIKILHIVNFLTLTVTMTITFYNDNVNDDVDSFSNDDVDDDVDLGFFNVNVIVIVE